MGVFGRNVQRVTHPERQTDAQARRAPRVALIAGAALVAIVLIAVLARVIFGHQDNGGAAAPATPMPASNSAAAAEPAPAAGSAKAATGQCQLDNSAKDISDTPPRAERWVLAGYGLVPQVNGAGPCTELSEFKAGYAHTMTGALVAAQTYVETFDVDAPTSSTKSTLEYAVVDGPLKDALRTKVKAISSGEQNRQDTSVQASLRLRGYRISSFTNEDAVVELLYGSTAPELAGQLADGSVHLQWVGEDWRIVPPSAEDWFSASKVSSTAGFTSWSPSGTGGTR